MFSRYQGNLTTLLVGLLLTACSEQVELKPTSSDQVDVNIRWTSYGIPHVKADDWRSLGYGFAYATATDGVCVIARDVVTVNGNLLKHFGEKYRASDVFHKAMINAPRLKNFSIAQSPRAQNFSAGYVAGYNRYIADHRDSLPASCEGQAWVRPISIDDITRLTLGVGIRYGLGQYSSDMAAAQPPSKVEAENLKDTALLTPDQATISPPLASNAVAFGRAVTSNGKGILFGNPHYPWSGPSRFHLIHMTLPGEIDVMGTSLLSTAGVSIGFNHDIAWSHTVSTGMRATLYKLELHPEDPTQYRYEGGYRKMETREVDLSDGKGAVKVYFSHFGPIVERKDLPWTNSEAYAVRDANLNNFHAAATYDAMGKAKNVNDIVAALNIGGVSWVNTIAADSAGNALYADISTVPNVDAELIANCKLGDVKIGRKSMIILDGSKPECEWADSSNAKVPGAMPTEVMPKLIRDDYVTNSNDSYWLSNPQAPLEGYSPIIGAEGSARSLRTRAGLKFVDELIQAGPIEVEATTSLIDSHRNFGAELLLDDLLKLCTPERKSIAASCAVLKNWDRTHTVDSVGAHIWTEVMRQLIEDISIYHIPFSNADPVNTPAGLDIENPDVAAKLVDAIEQAQKILANSEIALDAALGDIQYAQRNDRKISIPGGEGWAGAFSMIVTQLSKQPGVGYSPIIHGNSIIQFVTWDDNDKVIPRGLLTYSQSQEPDSPHYADLTELYSRGEWIDFPFHEEEIANDPNLKTLQLNE